MTTMTDDALSAGGLSLRQMRRAVFQAVASLGGPMASTGP